MIGTHEIHGLIVEPKYLFFPLVCPHARPRLHYGTCKSYCTPHMHLPKLAGYKLPNGIIQSKSNRKEAVLIFVL